MTDTYEGSGCEAADCLADPVVVRPVRLCQTHRTEVLTGVLRQILDQAGTPREELSPPVQRMKVEEARKEFLKCLEYRFSSVKEIRPGDLQEVARSVGRSRGWVYFCLNQLVSSGVLEKDGSIYRKKGE